jgi:hypothetical protein
MHLIFQFGSFWLVSNSRMKALIIEVSTLGQLACLIRDAPGLVSSTAATVRYYLRSPTKNLLRGALRYDSSPHLESSLHRRGAGRCCSNPFPHLRANTLNLGGAARCYSIPNTRQTMTCWASESEANGEEANYTIRSAGQNI